MHTLQEAYNFALFSSAAQGVSLVLFTEQDLAAGRATYEIPLDPDYNRTGALFVCVACCIQVFK